MASGRPTIAEVAARAGVGVSTVSRVMNDGQVSAPARERVQAAISELAYRPRASAQALASGSTGTVGLVIPFFTHPSAVERVRGVLRSVAHRLTSELLALPEPPTAIFAASDTQALGVLEAAGDAGVDVPGDCPSSGSTISPWRRTSG